MGRCKVGGERLLSFFQKVLSDSQEKRHYLTNTRSICLSLSAQKFFITYSLLLLQKEFLASDIILHLV